MGASLFFEWMDSLDLRVEDKAGEMSDCGLLVSLC